MEERTELDMTRTTRAQLRTNGRERARARDTPTFLPAWHASLAPGASEANAGRLGRSAEEPRFAAPVLPVSDPCGSCSL